MGYIKNYYHDEICEMDNYHGDEPYNDEEERELNELKWESHTEDYKIIECH